MNIFERLARRVRALFAGGSLDRELSEEMRLHLDLETDDLVRTRGLDRDEARRQAMIAFGTGDRWREAHRDARGVRWLEDSMRDVRYAFRVLARSPGYTVSAALILALAIGATTAVFSGVNAVLLHSLPYPREEQLVRLFNQNSPTNRWTLSVVDFRAVQEQARTIAEVGAIRLRMVPVSTGGETKSMTIAQATAGVFRALDVHPAFGRAIERADETQGAPAVAVVTYHHALGMPGGPSGAVGRTLTIDGIVHTVVGVLPPGVMPLGGWSVDVWPALKLETPTRRGPFGLFVFARLKDGVTLDAARRDLQEVSDRVFPIWANGFQDKSARLIPYSLRSEIIGRAGTTLGLFAAAAGLVLLIAVANVASLTLVRATARAPELAMRTVLGASRARLVRLVVIESLVLALAGAVGGIALGALALDLLVRMGPYVPRLNEARLDPQALLFAAGVAIAAGVIVGAYPVISLMRQGAGTLRSGARAVGVGRRAQAVRGAFVAAEFALALPVLAGAGLLLNGFLRLSTVDPGFDPAPIVTMSVAMPAATYPNDSAMQLFWRKVVPALQELPGVAGVGIASEIPPDDHGSRSSDNFDLIDAPVAAGMPQPTAAWVIVSREFFDAFHVPVLSGRAFSAGDTASGPPVMIVSRSWEKHYFPGRSAVGRQLIQGGCIKCPHTTIVGVVSDLPFMGLADTRDAMYTPADEGVFRVMHLFIRASDAASAPALLARTRETIRAVDPGVALDRPELMRDAVYGSVAEPRHLATLLGGFAASAVALAAVGIFGLLSYTVRMRTKEIGVRMALGAQRGEVVGEIVRRGMMHAGIGAAIGIVVAVFGTRRLADLLYGVSATDPVTLVAVTALLLLVALIASWLPARRAAGIDPVGALRED